MVMDFQSFNQDDEEDGAELFFEGPEPAVEAVEAPPPAAVIAPVPPAKNIAPAAAAAPPPAAAEDPLAAAALPDPEAPATPAAEKPAATPTPRVMNIALILAAVASLFSAIGLLVSVRNVAVLHEQQKEAEHRAATFERLPALLAEVEKLAADQRAELARAAASSPSALVTSDELSRQLNALRFALAKNQAPGTTTLAGVVRRGQEELTHRIDDINERIDKLEPKGRH
jgi:hypothetical protein